MHLSEAKNWPHLPNLLMQQNFVPLVLERVRDKVSDERSTPFEACRTILEEGSIPFDAGSTI
jgi:hypothetical protein